MEDESYTRRRDQLLEMMKRQRWDDEPKQYKKKGRKPKSNPVAVIDQTKARNKFFKYD